MDVTRGGDPRRRTVPSGASVHDNALSADLKREREYLRRVQQTLRLFLQRLRRSSGLLHKRHILLRVLFQTPDHVTYFADLLRLRTTFSKHDLLD